MIPHSRTTIGTEEVEAASKLLNSLNLAKGNISEVFKDEFKKYIGAEFVNLTSSGTMAFFLILKSLEVKNGDEVLLPDYICNSLLGPINALEASPIVYDNQLNSWISNEDQILKKVTKRTKAVVVNHTFGYTLNFLESLSKRLPDNVVLIEDCCHVIVNSSHELSKYVSKYSLCSFFSFNATKLLASGEGGAISTNNEKFASKISAYKIGDNLSNLSCSIALEQLKKLDYFLNKRKEIAELYISEFKNYLPSEFDYYSGIYFRFPILFSKNSEFWYSKTISYRKGVDSLISMSLNVKAQVNAYNILKDTVSLPIFPSLENFELEKIVSETHKLIRNAN